MNPFKPWLPKSLEWKLIKSQGLGDENKLIKLFSEQEKKNCNFHLFIYLLMFQIFKYAFVKINPCSLPNKTFYENRAADRLIAE